MHTRMEDDGSFTISSSGKLAVEQQAQVVLAQIRARTIQRLGLYILSAVFVIAAAFLVLFAPDGREMMSVFIGLALLVAAAGSAGYAKFGVKIPGVSAQFN